MGSRCIPVRIVYSGVWNDDDMYVDYQISEINLGSGMTYIQLMQSIMGHLGMQDSIDMPTTYVSLGSNMYVSRGVKLDNDKDVQWIYIVLSIGTVCGCTLVVDARNCLSTVLVDNPLETSTDEMDARIGRFHDNLDIGKLPGGFKLMVNDIFLEKKKVKDALSAIALRDNFQFRTIKSCKKLLVVSCVDEKCEWTIRVSRRDGEYSETWIVRKVIDEHTCSFDIVSCSQKEASASLIKEVMKNKVSITAREFEKSASIVQYIRSHHGINISYHKAYRARQHIMQEIHGAPEDSYARLPSYIHMLMKKNPGSYTDLKYDEDNTFKYYFQAMSASIEGWKHCRPILSVDGTFIKSKFGGTLLAATSNDGNNQIFPLAVAAVDSENNESWKWFITNLKKIFGGRDDLVVISDRHNAISNAIAEVWPEVFHGICMKHLQGNMKDKHKGKFDNTMLFNAAKAYNHIDFEMYMRHLESGCPGIREELQEIGFHRWSRAYCPRLRWTTMTNNSCESYNNVIIKAREMPITAMFESIRMSLQAWFNARRQIASYQRTNFTLKCEDQLRKQINIGHYMQVYPIDDVEWQVVHGTEQHQVHLGEKRCTCRQFDQICIPCPHASAVLLKKNMPSKDYVSHFYSNDTIRKTYAGLIYPVGYVGTWDIPLNIKNIKILPLSQDAQLVGLRNYVFNPDQRL